VETIKVGIAPNGMFKARMLDIASGKVKVDPEAPKIWFSSMQSLSQVLSENNVRLLNIIRQEKPRSIKELEELSGRASSNISRTLRTFEQHGLVEMRCGRGNTKYPVTVVAKLNIEMDLDLSMPA